MIRNDLAASWVLIPCPECDGEGYSEVSVPGGFFDLHQQCWYPWEKVVRCPSCHGQGQIEVSYQETQDDWEEAA